MHSSHFPAIGREMERNGGQPTLCNIFNFLNLTVLALDDTGTDRTNSDTHDTDTNAMVLMKVALVIMTLVLMILASSFVLQYI